MVSPRAQPLNKTQELFYKINDYTCLMGRLNLWGQDTHYRRLAAISRNYYYKVFYTLTNILVIVLSILQLSAVSKRDELNAKQMTDWIIFTFSNPLMFFFYFNIMYSKNEAKALLHSLTVVLKKIYNDKNVEREMINHAKFYMAAYFWLCSLSLILYGFDGLLQVIRYDKTFVTFITIWPDDEDKSRLASIARIFFYLIWWIIIFRTSSGYVLAISSTICLSHQFKTLHSYFYQLNDIFTEQHLTQVQKEEKYEKAFKVGVKLHSNTLWCTRQCQIVYGVGYSSQTTISLMGLVVVMFQLMNSERNILNALALLATASTILVTTGIFMWNAGDVTVEASGLATAMYCSGWENCERASSVRVRKLLVTAMTQAQQPVIIRAFGGIMDLSYGSYLSIVKSSYSVFSVVY